MSPLGILQRMFVMLLLQLKDKTSLGKKEQSYEPYQQEEGTAFLLLGKDIPDALVLFIIGQGFLFMVVVLLIYHYLISTPLKKLYRNFCFNDNGGSYLPPPQSRQFTIYTPEQMEIATAYYSEERKLGQGGYGKVYMGMLANGTLVAIKIARKVNDRIKHTFIDEAVVLTELRHPNIVTLLGFCLHVKQPILVYEFINGITLKKYIHEKNKKTENGVSWDATLRIITSMAGALHYMHSYEKYAVYHRDLKPDNILLDKNNKAYLADFGLAKINKARGVGLTLSSIDGTPGFTSPEAINLSNYTDRSDVYSFGLVLVEVLTGKNIYHTSGLAKMFYESVKEGEKDILDDGLRNCRNKKMVWTVANIAKTCLHRDIEKRPTMKQVLEALHGTSLPKNLLCYDGRFSSESSEEEQSLLEETNLNWE